MSWTRSVYLQCALQSLLSRILSLPKGRCNSFKWNGPCRRFSLERQNKSKKYQNIINDTYSTERINLSLAFFFGLSGGKTKKPPWLSHQISWQSLQTVQFHCIMKRIYFYTWLKVLFFKCLSLECESKPENQIVRQICLKHHNVCSYSLEQWKPQQIFYQLESEYNEMS